MSTSSPPPPPPQTNNNHTSTVISGCSFFLALLHCRRNKKRTTPSSDSDSNQSASRLQSNLLVPAIGFSFDPKRRRFVHSFSPKIVDFGLARLKSLSPFEIRKEGFDSDETEIESIFTSFEDYETDIVGVGGGGRVKKSGSVKDYVMDWIGKEVKEQKLKNDDLVRGSGKGEKSKSRKKLEWWKLNLVHKWIPK
ncbi:hypothetical protein P8452_26707 [Trifolium repens]|nr:hypothetical protein P8452_26707 [Trifolium repens]